MASTTIEDKMLEQHQLRKTPMRRKILSVFQKANRALSQGDIEVLMPDADRITLYRTLKTFEKSGMVHRAVDGTKVVRYALCGHECSKGHHKDSHLHFRCKGCGHTTCVENVKVPELVLPKNYQLDEAYVVAEGMCPNCAE